MASRVEHFALLIFGFEEWSEYFLLVLFTYTNSVIDNLNLNLDGSLLEIQVVAFYLDFFFVRRKLDCIRDQVKQNLYGPHLI